MNEQNRIHNSTNAAQGSYKKVLCVCSAGLLRSPTVALVLSQFPYNFNTRAAGLVSEFALITVDDVLLHWADVIVCMDVNQQIELKERLKIEKPVYNLSINDNYGYRDEKLIRKIKERVKEYFHEV